MKHKQSMLTLVCSMVLVLAMATFAGGEIPQVMTYQGVLADSDGRPLDGSYDITAKLYTAASGTTAIWTETHTGVAVAKGVFALMLGRYTALSELDFDQRLWLGISVNQGAEMEPRVELASVGTAFLAKNVVDGAITEQKIATGQIVKSINGATDHLNIVGYKDIYVKHDGDTFTIYKKECDWSGWGPWSASCYKYLGSCISPTNDQCCSSGPRTRQFCEDYLITDTQSEQICLTGHTIGQSCP